MIIGDRRMNEVLGNIIIILYAIGLVILALVIKKYIINHKG